MTASSEPVAPARGSPATSGEWYWALVLSVALLVLVLWANDGQALDVIGRPDLRAQVTGVTPEGTRLNCGKRCSCPAEQLRLDVEDGGRDTLLVCPGQAEVGDVLLVRRPGDLDTPVEEPPPSTGFLLTVVPLSLLLCTPIALQGVQIVTRRRGRTRLRPRDRAGRPSPAAPPSAP